MCGSRQAHGHGCVGTDICPAHAKSTLERAVTGNEASDSCESAHPCKAAPILNCDVGMGGCRARRDGGDNPRAVKFGRCSSRAAFFQFLIFILTQKYFRFACGFEAASWNGLAVRKCASSPSANSPAS